MRVRKRGRGGTKGRHATSSLGASEFTYGTHPPTQQEEEEEEKEEEEDKMVPTHPPSKIISAIPLPFSAHPPSNPLP